MAFWEPSQMHLFEWWDAPADIADATGITTWEGYQGRILTGAGTVQTGFVNGLPVVEFNGSTNFFELTDFDLVGQPVSVFAVWKCANSASQTLLMSDSTDTLIGVNSSSQYEVNGGSALAGAITLAAWRMTGALLNSAASARTIDGTNTTGDAGAEGFGPDLYVGASSSSGTESNFLNGQIATLILIDGVWAAAERQRLEGWAAWRYGLMGNLASTHPWKSTRPPA